MGPAIVKEIHDAGFKVTVLTRGSTKDELEGVDYKSVDYEDASTLATALKGIDAVVSNLGAPALGLQSKLIDAAIEAGVKRFIPSEFGCDTTNPKTAALPVFGAKVGTQKYLAAVAKEGKITYTLVATGAFLDWGIGVTFLANVKGGKTTLFDGGDVPFSATTLSSIGKAVAGVLKKPEETKNRIVYVQSALVTQNGLLNAGRKAKPGLETPIEEVSSEKLEQDAYKVLETKQGDIGAAMGNFVRRAMVGPGYGAQFKNLDNDLLGVPSLSEKQLEELVASYV